jgi:hypothetical protein
MPTDVARLQVHLGLTGARDVDNEAMGNACDAANDWVSTLRTDLDPWVKDDDSVVWPARVDEAATLLAAYYYGRRASVTGVASFADAGVAALPQTDPSVASLLELGRYQTSVIA